MKKPVAVVISDLHYTLSTLDLADAALRDAIRTAQTLAVPVIDCGDLTNDKAVLRAEVVNKLLETVDYAHMLSVTVHSIVGNHSLLNERTTGVHALNFLARPGRQWQVHRVPMDPVPSLPFRIIPYQSSPEAFYNSIQGMPEDKIVFAHQGNLGGDMGDYVQDRTAVDPKKLKKWRVFSGHYHKHYENENWVSIGNPYTLSYGEANDGPKGYLIVYTDGSFERKILPLRKHIKTEEDAGPYNPGDLVWLTIRGKKSQLNDLKKDAREHYKNAASLKIELIPDGDTEQKTLKKDLTPGVIMDTLVDELQDTDEEKIYLKQLWRSLIENQES